MIGIRIAFTNYTKIHFNPLNAELNSICHLLALLGAHHILHVSRISVNILVCPAALGFNRRREPNRDGEIWSGCLAVGPAYIKFWQKEQLQQLFSVHLVVNHCSVIFFSSPNNKCEYISVYLLFSTSFTSSEYFAVLTWRIG